MHKKKNLPEKHLSDPFDNLRLLVLNDLAAVDRLIISAADNRVNLIPEISNYLTSAGGKRLRPLLTLACAGMFGGDASGAHIKLATAVEYIHTATLFHDDVIDGSGMRRGKKVANLVWGNKPCILVGDYLLSQAFVLMVSAGNMQALELLARTACSITESEIWQLELIKKIDLTIEDYISLIKGKTALLFAAACSVGGMVTKRSEIETAALYGFGLNLGICFQIIDDALDYTGSIDTFGKAVGNDLKEGKVTLPLIFAFESCAVEEKRFLSSLLEGQDIDIDRLHAILTSTSAMVRTKEVAIQYSQKAIGYLDELGGNAHVSALRAIAEYIPDRVS